MQIWMESEFRYQMCMHLCAGVFVSTDHVKISVLKYILPRYNSSLNCSVQFYFTKCNTISTSDYVR